MKSHKLSKLENLSNVEDQPCIFLHNIFMRRLWITNTIYLFCYIYRFSNWPLLLIWPEGLLSFLLSHAGSEEKAKEINEIIDKCYDAHFTTEQMTNVEFFRAVCETVE